MLDPVIPISGVSVEFTREIQVSGDEALSLQLEIAGEQEKPSFEKRVMLIALILLCILAHAPIPRFLMRSTLRRRSLRAMRSPRYVEPF